MTALLPREHGSWALALEPLVLAGVAAPSWRGVALAGAGLALFLMRRPWQAVTHGRDEVRMRQAWRALGGLGSLTLLAGGAAVVGSSAALSANVATALAVAALSGGCFAWADAQRQARGAVAEVAGASCFAAWAAGMVLCSGRTDAAAAALGVAGFAWARALTSILPLRVFVRRRKGQDASLTAVAAVLVAVVGVCAAAGCAAVGAVPSWVPAAWLVFFLFRTLWLVGPRPPRWTPRQLGITEAVVGAAAVICTGIALS